MKTIRYYIPFQYQIERNMELANKLLEVYMELALKQAQEEGPDSLINISVKGTDNIPGMGPGYILRIVFEDPSEQDKIEAYMKMCEEEK